MSEIQDEAYSEACEEIERLKTKCSMMTQKAVGYSFLAGEQKEEIERLKALCARAANLLDGYGEYRNFITELREAAQ